MAPRGQSLMWLRIRTALFGSPLTTEKVEHSRVGVLGGIPIFGSDIISSQGYAPDEILMVLLLAGAVGYSYLMKVSLVIIILLASIFMVYRKAISKYPQGAGSYVISKNNLGEMFALIAGSSLTIEYVLTVAVSVSSAIENLTGIFPILATHKILACCIIILFLTWINLRGLKESAKLFALPVYLYIASLALLVFTGISEIFLYGVDPTIVSQNMQKTAEGSVSVMTWFIFARAFAGGTTALTGFEAVASGVSAFKIPNQKRATQTLFILALIVGAGLAGITFLAGSYHIVPSSGNTALNQLGLIVFGKTIFYYVLMGCAASILIIASNTPFAGFPILLNLMARDTYAPRYFKNMGDRLVFNTGIWTLCLISVPLIIFFKGNTHSMLALYAIGVLLSFSFTGFGMARYVLHDKKKGWQSDLVIFLFGGLLSFFVFLIFIITKFTQGAWLVLIIIPLLVAFFYMISRVYKHEIKDLSVTKEAVDDFQRHVKRIKKRRGNTPLSEYRNKIIIPVYDLNLIVLKAMRYAYALTPQLSAVHIASDRDRVEKIRRHWAENEIDIPLEIIPSPYRSTVKDFLEYVDKVEREHDFETITVVIPEYVPEKLRHQFLHNQTGQLIKLMLLLRNDIFVTSIPYHSGADSKDFQPNSLKYNGTNKPSKQ